MKYEGALANTGVSGGHCACVGTSQLYVSDTSMILYKPREGVNNIMPKTLSVRRGEGME